MRFALDRGSGSMTTVIAIGALVAVGFGLLAGIAVIRAATTALRTAEQRAVAVATLVSEGERNSCGRLDPPVIDCQVNGRTATVTVEIGGNRASATAGPDR